MAVSVAAALLLVAVFAGDSVWTAVAALLVAGTWGALALAGRAPLPAGGGVLAGLLLATAAWSGLSIAWSVAPDLSWAELDRTLVYAPSSPSACCSPPVAPMPARLAAMALTAAFGAASSGPSPARRSRPLFPDGGRAARLRDPIGYWNALALAADVLLVLALSLRRLRRERSPCGWAARRSPTRRSSRCCSRRRVQASQRRCSGSCSGSGFAATGSRRRCSCSSRPIPAARRRRLGVHAAGARRGREPRMPTASPTAPGSGCSWSSAPRSSPSVRASSHGVRSLRLDGDGSPGVARARVRHCVRDRRRPRRQRRPDRGRVPGRGGAERPGHGSRA